MLLWLQERLDNWRRKSEPTCYDANSPLTPISLELKQLPEDQSIVSDVSANTTLSDANETLDVTSEALPEETPSPEDPEHPDETTQTIEEIVGQLLMQNREFQRILKKQQRQINMRHRISPYSNGANRDETSDEEEAIYETLSALATVQTSNRPLTVCSNDDDDYVTLVCHEDVPEAEPARLPPLASPEKDTVSIHSEPIDLQSQLRVKREEEPTSKPSDSYQNIWERLRRSHGKGKRTSELEKIACRVRRAQSFNAHTDSERRSCFYVESPGAGPEPEPASLAAWLSQQAPHLRAPAPPKAGSLPRSFQMGSEGEALPGRGRDALRSRLLRDGRPCPDRPFTIASDKPPIDLMDEERQMFRSDDTTEEDSFTEYTSTPTVSMSELNVHPEYKIYRPSISKASLRNVICSMTKLAGLRISSETLESNGSAVNGSEWGAERPKCSQRERRVNRAAAVIVKQYSRTLRKRIRNLIGEDNDSSNVDVTPQPDCPDNKSPAYKQGSSNLGARIAHCSESEYANPRSLFPPVRPSKKAAALLGIRPQSVLSISSNLTSSSDGDKTSGFGGSVDTTSRPLGQTDGIISEPKTSQCDDAIDSDGSADSFYERSFEAMESAMEADMFRDSAVFSDQDSSDSAPRPAARLGVPSPIEKVSSTPLKVPPPVPAKPKIRHIITHFDSCGKTTCRESDGSFSEGREFDECDTSSQYSAASTVIEISEPATNGIPNGICSDMIGPTSRGWVRHVIGRLQGANQPVPQR